MEGRIELPSPSYRGTRTLEEVLAKRHDRRAFLDRPIELSAMGQILWAGLGLRYPSGGRATPSMGDRSPLDLYVITEQGLAHYLPEQHQIEALISQDLREALYRAAYFEESIQQAPFVIVITADFGRSEQQNEEGRSERLALMECGHVAQNILLQAYAIGLAGVVFGAFKDKQVSEALNLSPEQRPLNIIAIGYSLSEG